MNPGKLYGVGLGPGARDLITLRAVNCLKKVDCIAIPQRTFGKSLAWEIAAETVGDVPEQDRFFLDLPMSKDPSLINPAWEIAVKEVGERIFVGKDVAYIAEGDPFVYSSFGYLYNHVKQQWPQVTVEVIPGVSSISAVPIVAGIPIADGQERVAIIPAAYNIDDLTTIFRMFDTILLLKVSNVIPQVVAALEEENLLDKAVYVHRATMDDQKVIRDIKSVADKRCGYFSMIVVSKKTRSGVLRTRE